MSKADDDRKKQLRQALESLHRDVFERADTTPHGSIRWEMEHQLKSLIWDVENGRKYNG